MNVQRGKRDEPARSARVHVKRSLALPVTLGE